jgi:hypothetical protein
MNGCSYGAHATEMPFVTFDVALVQKAGGFRYQTWYVLVAPIAGTAPRTLMSGSVPFG